MRTCFARLSLLLLALALFARVADAADSPAGKSVFSLGDLEKLSTLSKPALSADGTQAALIVSRPDGAQNRLLGTLVLVNTKTADQRVIATGDVADPAFSPQGDQLAWLAPGADQTTQIMMLRLNTSSQAPQVVTTVPTGTGVRRFAWSPDGNTFAYLAQEPPVPAVGDARFDRTFEVSDSDYLGTSYLARNRGIEPARLWLIPATGGGARLFTSKGGAIEDLAWSPDGSAVVVNTHPGTSDVSERLGSISAIGIETSQETIVVPPPAHVAPAHDMTVSAQGLLAYQHYRGDDPWTYGNQVAVVQHGQSRDITAALDRDVSDFDWLPDGKSLLVQAPDHLRTGLWTVSLTGAVHRVDLGALSADKVTLNRRGTLLFVGTGPTLPPELYVMSSLTSKPVRLTFFNRFIERRQLGDVRTVAWSNDGYDQQGVLTYPPDYRAGRKYPLLVSIHGGPEYSAQLSFNSESQFYAANGWLVFEPNYRGSNGQGDRYETAVIGDATAGPGRDIRSGLAAVEAEGIVDEERIAVTGYSYGGVMTSWLIGHHRDWCAAVPGGNIIDFAQYYDQSSTGIWIRTLLGSPHVRENHQKYVDQSPASYLTQVSTPTLIMQNAGDPNATVGQAYQLYHALKDNGVKARFIVSDLDGHEPDDPFHRKQAYDLTLDWIQENCPPAH